MNRGASAAGFAIWLSLLLLAGCGQPNLRAVHEAPLLDNKVLQRRVEAALKRAGSGYGGVRVSAESGTVTLSGTVGSAEASVRAEEIAGGVYGVKKTDNEIMVKASAPSFEGGSGSRR